MSANWNNTAGGKWSDSGNWTNAALPKRNDNVTFAISPIVYTTTIDLGYTQAGLTVPVLNSVNLQPHMILDIERSITINAINNASGTDATTTGGLVEIGNGAIVNYNVGDYNEASLFVAPDGIGPEGTLVVDGPIDTGGTITMDGVNFDATGGIIDSTAFLALENGATYVAQASETFNLGTIKLAGGGVADFAALPTGAMAFGGFSPTDQQVIMVGRNNVLVLPHTGDETSLTVSGFDTSDKIEVANVAVESATYDASGHLNFFSGPNGTGSVLEVLTGVTLAKDLPATLPAADFTIGHDATTGDMFVEVIACFLPGTRIRTDRGEVPVETLKTGDTVITLDGQTRRLCWVGRGQTLATRGRRNAATPVIVRKGALADNVPYADLRITKGHSLYLDGVLIPVEFLVNHRSILWDDRAQEVSVFHLELEGHDVLVANGAAAESYRDDGNRWLFNNLPDGDAEQLAKPPCAPVLTGGPIVDAIWRRLLDRAGKRGGVPLTDDPDLHLLVDGQRLDATKATGDSYVFTLRERPEVVRIVSRAAVPQELGTARDPRCLGVALQRVAAQQGPRFRLAQSDDPRLQDGFHAFEPDTGCRWTNGDAGLPMALLEGWSGAIEIVLVVGGSTPYIDDGAAWYLNSATRAA